MLGTFIQPNALLFSKVPMGAHRKQGKLMLVYVNYVVSERAPLWQNQLWVAVA